MIAAVSTAAVVAAAVATALALAPAGIRRPRPLAPAESRHRAADAGAGMTTAGVHDDTGPYRRRLGQRRRSADAQRRRTTDLPDAIDLLVLATTAGLSVSEAVPVAARWGPSSLASGWHRVAERTQKGEPLSDAVTALRETWGPDAAGLVSALVSHLLDGTALGDPLRRVADDARDRRRRTAESRARRLPVVLLFPLVFCTLPAFALLTVAPLVIGALGSIDAPSLEPLSAPFPSPPDLEAPASVPHR